MSSLITPAEAREYGRLTEHAEIEALVERAWEVRVENFGDSTDMCSLVNAKSGGCAEDCGFCAQSRYAEADTPMHAMMEPEQILEHAKAAEAAGAHRFCMVTQGQGLSKRDFQKILEGTRLVAEQTNLKRCASIGHMSADRAKALKEAGVQRVHHNVESARSYYPEVSTTVRYEGRLRTIKAVKEAGLETCVGGILNLGESEEQRVEMAFELSEINPTSVPINLLIPKEGTKFGDREVMDPWEVVKWIAIFRLIIPGALFRLCGGRVENLGELHGLAVKAGLNGVMMGNFLTTLGAEPAEDRAMFEELGLNVARQPDNGANPRPDNRSGWLEGDSPATPIDELIDSQEEANFWDPSTQLRVVKKAKKPPSYPRGVSDVSERLDELRERGLYRQLRLIEGPQGPTVTLDGQPVLLLCSNNYLGLADRAEVREAAAQAALRWGAGAGASRLISGSMEPHRSLEARLAAFKGYEAALLFGSGYLANTGVIAALAGRDQVVFSDELNHASIVDGCRLSRAETFVYRHRDVEHLAWGLRQAGERAALIVTDGVFSMDGDVAPLPQLFELARHHGTRLMVDEAHATGAVGPGGRGSVSAAGLSGEVDVVVGTLGKALGSYGAYACASAETVDFLINCARPFIFSTAPPPTAVAAAEKALAILEAEPQLVERLQANAETLRSALAGQGLEVGSSTTQVVPIHIGDAETTMEICERALLRGVFAQGIRPPTVPEGSSRLRLTAMATHRRQELVEAAAKVAAAAHAVGLIESQPLAA
jgi:biotin synthase